MALSGSYDFSLNRNDIIRQAYDLSGVADAGETLSASQVATASDKLNIINKSLMSNGLKLWTWEDIVFFPVLNRYLYTLSATGDRFALRRDLAQTTLDGATLAGVNSFDVTSATGIVANDIIGISNGSVIEWLTVQSVASNTITISGTLASAYADGVKVFSYTPKMFKPLKIEEATVANDTGSASPVTPLSHHDRMLLSSRDSQGLTSQYHYQPRITDGHLEIFPSPTSEEKYLNFVTRKPFDDLDTATDDAPYPSEYYQIAIYELASVLALQEGYIARHDKMKSLADEKKTLMTLHDAENVKLKIDLGELYARR